MLLSSLPLRGLCGGGDGEGGGVVCECDGIKIFAFLFAYPSTVAALLSLFTGANSKSNSSSSPPSTTKFIWKGVLGSIVSSKDGSGLSFACISGE
jgi:hypothetical protein